MPSVEADLAQAVAMIPRLDLYEPWPFYLKFTIAQLHINAFYIPIWLVHLVVICCLTYLKMMNEIEHFRDTYYNHLANGQVTFALCSRYSNITIVLIYNFHVLRLIEITQIFYTPFFA